MKWFHRSIFITYTSIFRNANTWFKSLSRLHSLDVINGVCTNTIFIPEIERTCDAIIIFLLLLKLLFNLKAPLYHFQLIYFSAVCYEVESIEDGWNIFFIWGAMRVATWNVCVCDGNEFHSFSFQRVNVLWNCSRIKANGFLWKLYRKSAFKLFTSINKSRRNNVSQANKVIVFREILRRSFSVFRELLRQINVACVLLKTTLNRFTSDKLFLGKTHF